MKRFFYLALLTLFLFLPFTINAETEQTITIHYFENEWCLVCADVKEFLNDNYSDDENIVIKYYDVISEKRYLFDQVNEFYEVNGTTPSIVIGSTILIDQDDIEKYLDELITYYQESDDYYDIVQMMEDGETVVKDYIIPVEDITDADKTFDIPIIGEVNLKEFSLFFSAIFLGLLDGFNPCAMWVLVFLITMLINLKDRRRMWILGLTFILTSGLVYFAIMMAWFKVVEILIFVRPFQYAIGLFALVFAFFSLKKYWRQHKIDTGCEVQDEDSKRRLMTRIKNIMHTNHILFAMVGIIGVALTVNVIELACSVSLPFTFTSMLAAQGMSNFQSVLYILLYVFFFVLDDIIIFSIAVISFRVTGLSAKYSKYTNLIGGILMVVLGFILIFFPSLLF
jgi:hypothetical protein